MSSIDTAGKNGQNEQIGLFNMKDVNSTKDEELKGVPSEPDTTNSLRLQGSVSEANVHKKEPKMLEPFDVMSMYGPDGDSFIEVSMKTFFYKTDTETPVLKDGKIVENVVESVSTATIKEGGDGAAKPDGVVELADVLDVDRDGKSEKSLASSSKDGKTLIRYEEDIEEKKSEVKDSKPSVKINLEPQEKTESKFHNAEPKPILSKKSLNESKPQRIKPNEKPVLSEIPSGTSRNSFDNKEKAEGKTVSKESLRDLKAEEGSKENMIPKPQEALKGLIKGGEKVKASFTPVKESSVKTAILDMESNKNKVHPLVPPTSDRKPSTAKPSSSAPKGSSPPTAPPLPTSKKSGNAPAVKYLSPHQRKLAQWVLKNFKKSIHQKNSKKTLKHELKEKAKPVEVKDKTNPSPSTTSYKSKFSQKLLKNATPSEINDLMETSFNRLKHRMKYLNASTQIENKFYDNLKKKMERINVNIEMVIRDLEQWKDSYRDNVGKLTHLEEETIKVQNEMDELKSFCILQMKNLEKMQPTATAPH